MSYLNQLFEILHAGGIFMYAILVTSVVSVAMILHRVYHLFFRFRLDTAGISAEINKLVADRDYARAIQMCTGSHPVLVIMRTALMRANRSEKEIRRGVETVAVEELARYRRGSASLPQLSNLATLMGLLGTINGLIISFAGMQGADAATRQAALSKGVAIAFYNTFFGLTVAVTTVVAYLLVSSKQGRELTRMESAVASLIDGLLTTQTRSEPAPVAVTAWGA